MTAVEMLVASAARHAERVAIERADGSRVTYRELFARARETSPAEPVVEIDAERTVEFVAGCLGAWLHGRAFFPVDRRDPRPRARVTEPGLAYVIATSGSTGAPKLVMVGPRGLPALLRTQIDAFTLGPGARALWLHAPQFDASISDWGTALASGATLVLPTSDALASPVHLHDELASRSITHVDLPPSLLAHLDPVPPALRVVVLGGEACAVERVRALARRVRVVVVYGPTEATVGSSLVVVDPQHWDRPLIGHPLPGVTYRVVDGELCIGGDAVALGYAGDPEATARSFVNGMYRTGDRVDETPHGLVFVGRVDRQHKIAGRRLELDEVELALRAHVPDAAVVVRDGRLVAFVERALDRTAVALPAWMMPAEIVVGPLPRLPTGKIDRDALVVPAIADGDPIAVAWCKALGKSAVRETDRWDGDSLARLMFAAATGLTIDGTPAFAEVARSVQRAISVRALERDALARLATALDDPGDEVQGLDDVVLFTGATGFLGRRLLDTWRRRDPRPVVALVRDPAKLAGADLEVVRGDVGEPRLGLSRERWRALVARVSTVVHCAATMQLGGDLAAHDANIRGAIEIARMRRRWHHISTLSVFVSTDRARGRHEPHADPDPDAIAFGGYAQSKIAAEAIARACGAAIYRLGLLAGDRGQLPMTIRGLQKLGAAPSGFEDNWFDVTPVDTAAEAIAARAHLGGTHHIASTRGMSCAELIAQLGVEVIAANVWREHARARIDDPDIAMAVASFSRQVELDLFRFADFGVDA